MPYEYEYRYAFGSYSHDYIVNRLKELGGVKHGHWLFRVQVFIHPTNQPHTYIRVRDEGHKITMTYKQKEQGKEFPEENEIIINDFTEGCKILLGVGCKKKYYYEKMREIWHIENTEICFDTNPGRPDIMEIESETEEELNKMVKLFGLENVQHDNFTEMSLYTDPFGIVIPPNVDLTFKTAKEILGPLCTKNKQIFNQLVDEQNKLFDKIKKNNKTIPNKTNIKRSSKQSKRISKQSKQSKQSKRITKKSKQLKQSKKISKKSSKK